MSAERDTTVFFNEGEETNAEKVFMRLVTIINRDRNGTQRLVVLRIAGPPVDDKDQNIGNLEIWPQEDEIYLLRYFKKGEDEETWGAHIHREGEVRNVWGIGWDDVGQALQVLIIKRRTQQGTEYGFKYRKHLRSQSSDLPALPGQELNPNPNLYVTSIELTKLDDALDEDAEKLYYWADPPVAGNLTYASQENPGTKIIIYGETPEE